MKTRNAYELRSNLDLREYNTAITREDFERYFEKTSEKVTFTFNGWDGKSYDGETKTARILKANIEGYEDINFVKVGKAIHAIDEEHQIEEKATGEKHPQAFWIADVLRKEN